MFTTRSSTDPQQKTLLIIKQDDKFFSRLLSRELSMNTKNGSFRGVPSSVPFTWESQPGTPKHHFHSGTVQPLPPLTPPPSYYSTHSRPFKRQTTSFRSNPIHTLFLKLNIITKPKSTNHAAHQPSSPSMSYYSSSSWSSSSSSSTTPSCLSSRRRSRFGSWGGSMSSSCSSSKVEEEEDDTGIVGSTMCFMIRRRNGSQKKGRLMSFMGAS